MTAIIIAVVFALVVPLVPQKTVAAPFDQKPVPTYSPVTSTDTITTATVPANLVNQWRGLYTRPAISVIGKTDKIPGATLKQFLMAWLNDKEPTRPVVTYKFNPSAAYDWTGSLAASVNATASEPSMKMENGRVTQFTPPQT